MRSIREIGDTCVGAKINGRLVPLRTQLGNGDQVEIVTSKAQTPSPTWERFVVTGKARARIRRFIRTQQRAAISRSRQGDRAEGVPPGRPRIHREGRSKAVLKTFDCADASRISTSRSARGCAPGARWSTPSFRRNPRTPRPRSCRSARARRKGKRNDNAVPIRGLIPGMALHFAGCCHPLPGDRIVGIVTTGKGVTIHTIDCETLESFADDAGALARRRLEQRRGRCGHVGRINVTIANEPGSLGSLTTVIGKQGGNISNLKITNRSPDFFEIMVDIEVAGREASDDDHRRAARHAGHQLGRAGARLTRYPATKTNGRRTIWAKRAQFDDSRFSAAT